MTKERVKLRKVKPYHIYGHGDGKLSIHYKVEGLDGNQKQVVRTRSTKNKSYKDAKKELITLAMSEMGKVRPGPNIKNLQAKKEHLQEKIKNGISPKQLEKSETMSEIDWNKMFLKPITMTIFASSRSGKSTFLGNLYKSYLKKLYDLNVLGSGSLQADIYKPFKKCIKISGINEEFIKAMYTMQKKTKGKFYKMMQMYDDVDVKSKYIDIINKCFYKMRNYGMSTILSVQDMKMVDKGVRNNSHLIMIMNTSRMDDSRLQFCFEILQPYFRHSLGEFTNAQQKKMIISWLHDVTDNYGFVLVNTIEQKVYQCKNKMED